MYFLKPDTTMKKIVYAGLALGLMTVVSCQKELTEGQMENTVAQITKTMYVEGNEWIPEADTRTAYEPGVGIDWTGNETFAIYYGDPDKAATATSENKYMQKATDVTALGGGKYSFKHEDLGISAYDYSVIVPDIATTGLQGAGKSATFKLSPVQTPGANTYDPNYDILFGQGAFGVAPAEELEITKFKRVTAPLRLSLSDGAGVIGDEKIHAATISFSQAAAGQNGFAGTLYLNFGYEYEDCKVNSFTAPSSSVTAVYAEGLSKDGSIWPVWYSVHPATFDAGGELTVTVTTETKTVSRTITLASAASIQADILNNLAFDISGEGYVETESLYWNFTELSGTLSAQQTASDGNPYNWGFESCQIWNGNDASGILPSSLRANANDGQITLPTIAGKQISKIRLYAHPNNNTSGNTISLNGAAGLNFNSYAVNTDTGNSGVLEITVPEDQYGQPLILTAGSKFAAFDGIGVELVEGAALPEADENDYYDLFTKGYDIEINGDVYNNSGYTARLIKATELEQSDLQADATTAGILFIDPEGQTSALETKAMAPGNAEKVVIIGRYKDSQPMLKLVQYNLRTDAVFKNMHLESGNETYLVRTNSGYESGSITFDDCTLDMTTSRYVAYDQALTYSFTGVFINNSIIEFNSLATNNPSIFAFSTSTSSVKTVFGPTDISITNSVIYSAATIQAYIVNMGDGSQDKYDTYNANLNVSNNTFYNIWQKNILVRGQVFQNFTVDKNVAGYVSGDVPDATSYLACAYKSAAASSISGNYLYSGVDAAPWTVVHGKSAIEAGADNVNDASAAPFTSENTETGYFPINTSVVTNGAGADYDTKYWVVK